MPSNEKDKLARSDSGLSIGSDSISQYEPAVDFDDQDWVDRQGDRSDSGLGPDEEFGDKDQHENNQQENDYVYNLGDQPLKFFGPNPRPPAVFPRANSQVNDYSIIADAEYIDPLRPDSPELNDLLKRVKFRLHLNPPESRFTPEVLDRKEKLFNGLVIPVCRSMAYFSMGKLDEARIELLKFFEQSEQSINRSRLGIYAPDKKG